MQGRADDVSLNSRAAAPDALAASGSARAQYRRLYRYVAVTDALSIAIALLLAYWARFGIRVPRLDFLAVLTLAPIFVVMLYGAFHLYGTYRTSAIEEFRRILYAVSLGVCGVLVIGFASQSYYSRLWLGLSWALSIVGALWSRRLWHAYFGRERARGRLAFPTLVVGTNQEARHLVELMELPSFGFQAIGMIATAARDPEPAAAPAPVLGAVVDLRELIRSAGAECVFVAESAMSAKEMGYVAKAVRLEGVEVRVTATLPEVLSSRVAVQSLGGVTSLSLSPVRLTGTQAAMKRVFDVLVAGTGMFVLAPVLGLLALCIKLSSPGPVLYRQRRIGRRGRPFTILKFRTMLRDSDKQVEDLRAQRGVNGLMFKLRDDPRVTPVGRFLRRWSLDELPQLINVIRGEMSLVGPRPALPNEVTRYEDWQFDRLEASPGMSGLWQVSGRSDLSFDDCVRLDLFYIENWSLAYDLYIMAKTLPVLISQRGAY